MLLLAAGYRGRAQHPHILPWHWQGKAACDGTLTLHRLLLPSAGLHQVLCGTSQLGLVSAIVMTPSMLWPELMLHVVLCTSQVGFT